MRGRNACRARSEMPMSNSMIALPAGDAPAMPLAPEWNPGRW